MQAPDPHTVARGLRDRELVPLTISRVTRSHWGSSFLHRSLPVPPSHLAGFFTQLASLLRSGVNPHEALDEMAGMVTDGRLARAATEMSREAAEGAGLADEMERYPALFPEHVVGLLRAGEELGGLPEMLEALAGEYEARARIKHRVRWPGLYYGGVLVLALLVAPFPLMVARGMGWYVDVLLTRLLPILVGVILCYLGFRALLMIPAVGKLASRVMLPLPIVGTLPRHCATVRFLSVLNLSQRAGVTLDRGIELAAEATGHEAMRTAARHAAARVRRGESVGQAVARVGFLPQHVREMLATAEIAGAMEERLEAAGNWATEQRDAAIDSISSGSAAVSLAITAIIVAVALAFAWRHLYEAIFERAGV